MQSNTLKSTTKIYGPIGKISQNKQVYLLQFGLLPINFETFLWEKERNSNFINFEQKNLPILTL